MARRRRRSSSRRAGSISLWGVLALLALLLIVYYLERGNGLEIGLPSAQPPATAPPRVAGGGEIRTYFTTPALIYPDRADARVPASMETALIADLDAAKSSIEMATFEYNLVSIVDALVRAKVRGVDVRLALDREGLERPEMADFAGRLQRAGVPISWEESDAFLHSKFVIVDKALVWLGSWNATVNDTYRNNNNMLRISIPEIVANYNVEFAQMEQGNFGRRKQALTPNPRIIAGNIPIENYFSPQEGPQARIAEKIRSAQSSIRFLAFSFTADAIKDAVLERVRAGVKAQGVFEQRNVTGQGGEYQLLKDGGAEVQIDGNCYTMHHKVFIIDDRIVITGSYNFTSRAENVNDENLLIIEDPLIAQQYIQEFDRVYGQALQPTRCGS
jgi:phosphatidylserine/phosphatidylglycerophosphate/cardiolipin synthase-like enzyme